MEKLRRVKIKYGGIRNNAGVEFERIVEIDRRTFDDLRMNDLKTLEHLVGHYHPGVKFTVGIQCKAIDEASESKNSNFPKRESNNKSIFRRPFYLIPFRLFWYLIKSIFKMGVKETNDMFESEW
jgi:hypothetical protein